MLRKLATHVYIQSTCAGRCRLPNTRFTAPFFLSSKVLRLAVGGTLASTGGYCSLSSPRAPSRTLVFVNSSVSNLPQNLVAFLFFHFYFFLLCSLRNQDMCPFGTWQKNSNLHNWPSPPKTTAIMDLSLLPQHNMSQKTPQSPGSRSSSSPSFPSLLFSPWQ